MNANVAIVIGAKGGAGATTLCVDAISRLSKNADVALVDGDLVARRAIAVLLDKVRALDGARTTPNIASIDDGRLTVVELTATFDGGFTIKPPDVAGPGRRPGRPQVGHRRRRAAAVRRRGSPVRLARDAASYWSSSRRCSA